MKTKKKKDNAAADEAYVANNLHNIQKSTLSYRLSANKEDKSVTEMKAKAMWRHSLYSPEEAITYDHYLNTPQRAAPRRQLKRNKRTLNPQFLFQLQMVGNRMKHMIAGKACQMQTWLAARMPWRRAGGQYVESDMEVDSLHSSFSDSSDNKIEAETLKTLEKMDKRRCNALDHGVYCDIRERKESHMFPIFCDHKKQINKYNNLKENPLRKNTLMDNMHLSHHKSNSQLNILVTCCGASFDMTAMRNYIAREYPNIRQFKIIGIDISERALKFFLRRENLKWGCIHHRYNFDLHPQSKNSLSVYETRHIILIHASIFDPNVIEYLGGEIDIIYDLHALSVINPSQRSTYMQVLKQLLKTDGGRIILSTFNYPKILSMGHPFSVQNSELEQLLKGWTQCFFKILHTYERNKFLEQSIEHLLQGSTAMALERVGSNHKGNSGPCTWLCRFWSLVLSWKGLINTIYCNDEDGFPGRIWNKQCYQQLLCNVHKASRQSHEDIPQSKACIDQQKNWFSKHTLYLQYFAKKNDIQTWTVKENIWLIGIDISPNSC
ncbi:hypothetical protein RFI_28709 [Reticulomyxa filosa]|uniref:Methyltransferase domain-containing protein n=1 Tax=Reticulomyxa filosa TaxID=46433 RepID=X6M5D2_RETFI|nr:hypothetical protein RFI_28709 [Reticulomyxa filosa]|eukprot:ETO08677.1 hypothetical protein RFI_28709 [Reticulomyxa filosa]